MKTIKRVNGFFLVLVILRIGASVGLSMLDGEAVTLGTYTSLMLPQLLILVPSFLFFIISGYDITEWIPFRKLRGGTVALIILFTFLIMPLITFVNVFSQLFTENAAVNMFSEMSSASSAILFLIVGLVGPFCEEFTFRGVIYGGLRKSGYPLAAAAVTGIYFGLMHLNLNQFCYVLVLGTIMCLVNEAAGSVWASIIAHVIVNTWNMLLMLLAERFYSAMGLDVFDQAGKMVSTDEKLSFMGILLVVSVVTILIAAGVFVAIGVHEGRLDKIKAIFRPDHEDGTERDRHIITIPGYLAMAMCLFVIFLLGRVLAFFTK
ncbi:MAG: CPBP family intramembrane metalloprotease [Lachnospiraceae bacterium]|nr:CPBP family intramembrane metalloprotease [Lachnospiraceae bacterium]